MPAIALRGSPLTWVGASLQESIALTRPLGLFSIHWFSSHEHLA
jgi:hypothetical protein